MKAEGAPRLADATLTTAELRADLVVFGSLAVVVEVQRNRRKSLP